MATFQQRLFVNGAHVRRLRKKQGWTQQELAYEADLSIGRIQKIEAGASVAVQRGTAEALAETLGVPVDYLITTVLPSWQSLPNLGPLTKLRSIMAHAIRNDMNGRHAKAAQSAASVLRSLNYSTNEVAYCEVYLRWISFTDNAGHHDKAIDQCDRLLQLLAEHRHEDERVLQRADYQRGIALRRSGQIWEALALFERLLAKANCPAMEASIHHQLGVIDIECAKNQDYLDRRSAKLESSLAHFKESLRIWDQLGSCHRRGFSLMRAGEALALRREFEAAMRRFVEAIKVLSFHNCTRYVWETERRIEELIYDQDAFNS
ncbi:MAG: helix-turn-helix domain-containing protein [Planctomycetota bacterium]